MANKFINKIKSRFFPNKAMPSGNVLQNTSGTEFPTVAVSSDDVNRSEPYGTPAPEYIKGRASGWSQIQNLSGQVDITKVQAALRTAERGDCTLLFGYYRDLFITTGMVAGELSKRKLAVISEPYTILPIDKTNKDDVNAARIIDDIISNCPNWNTSLAHLMNSIIYPVAVSEKIFRAAGPDDANPFGLRYYLDKLYPVDYMLVNYRLPYLPQGQINAFQNQLVSPAPPLPANIIQSGNGQVYNLDSWEPDLRFWHVFDNGLIDYAWSNIYAPDPDRHLVYRSNLLQGMARDNFGGLGRSLLFWAIMAQLGREFFLRMLDRYGVPFVVAHVDTAQTDTVKMLEDAFNMSNKLGALMVNKDAQIDIAQINLSGAAEGHKMFLDFCNDQISLLISGQTLSSHAKATGMGSGVAKLQSTVRDDLIQFDRLSLGNVLRSQLFHQLLKINGIKGRSPRIVWGGENPTNIKDLASSLNQLAQAGIRPNKTAMETLTEKFGFELELTDFSPNNKEKDTEETPIEENA